MNRKKDTRFYCFLFLMAAAILFILPVDSVAKEKKIRLS